MEPLCQFQYLDIQQCWPTSDHDFLRYAAQVTPRGRQGVAKGAAGAAAFATPLPASTRMLSYSDLASLTLRSATPGMISGLELGYPNIRTEVGACPHGVLQVCLLTMEPFQGCKNNELRDTHVHSPTVFECSWRPLLIETLADALLTYEEGRCDIMPGLQKEAADMQEALTTLARGCIVYEHASLSRGRRGLTNRPLTLKRLNQAFTAMDSAMAVLTPEHYLWAREITEVSYKNQLFIAMRKAFITYVVQKLSGMRYPMAAVHESIARIFCHFGVETDSDLRCIVDLSGSKAGPNYKPIVERLLKRSKDEKKKRKMH
jgi:hypothetical protein